MSERPSPGTGLPPFLVPVRCRTSEERAGFQRWRSAAPSLVERAAAADTVWFAYALGMKLLAEAKSRIETCRMVDVLAQAVARCPSAGAEPLQFVELQRAVTSEMLRDESIFDLAETSQSLGAKVRARFLSNEPAGPRGRAAWGRAAAVEAMASLTDEQLADLICVPNAEMTTELFGEDQTVAPDRPAFKAARARILRQRKAQQAEYDRAVAAMQRAQTRARPVLEDFAAAFRAARRLLPASGECADLSEILEIIEGRCAQLLGGHFTRLRPREPERANRILCRLPWWLGFTETRWTAPRRVVLRRMIEQPEKLAQLAFPPGELRAARKKLAMLDDEMPCPPERERPEFERLVGALERASANDAEIAWALCDYLAAETPLRHCGGAPHPGGQAIPQGEDVHKATVDLPGSQTLAGYLRIFSDLSIYDGKTVW